MLLRCEKGSTRRKSSLPSCPTQIPHGLAWEWTRPSAVRDRRMTIWNVVGLQECLIELWNSSVFIRHCCRVKRARREDGGAQCDTWTIMKGAYWLWKQQQQWLSADKTSWYSTKEGALPHGYKICNQFTPALSNIPELTWRTRQTCTAFSAGQSIHVDTNLNCDFWITKHQ
jgi:hypothetical protein